MRGLKVSEINYVSDMSKEEISNVDFEIAFTASIAALVIGFPLPELETYVAIKMSAISLLFLTLVRRLALMSGSEYKGKVLRVTTYLMSYSTFVSILYLFYYLSFILSKATNRVNLETLFLVVTTTFVLSIVVVHELIFRDFLYKSSKLFRKNPALPSRFSSTTSMKYPGYQQTLNTTSARDMSKDRSNKQENSAEESEVRTQITLRGLRLVISLVVVVTSVLIIYLASVIFRSGFMISLFLFIVTYLVMGLVNMYYSMYGLVNLRGKNWLYSFLTKTITYLFAIYAFV